MALGQSVGDKIDLSNCFNTLQKAKDFKKQLKASGNCDSGEALVFSIRFNDLGKPGDFKPDPKTGRVDMSKWTWKAKDGFTNFDFGMYTDFGTFFHANHCDPEGNPNCNKPKDRMKIYESTYDEFTKPLDDFNQIVFCTACRKKF